jgi:ubiquitin C-terminal hydrolase
MEIIFDKNGGDFLRNKVRSHRHDKNIEFELRFGKVSDKTFKPFLFPQETINRIRGYVENTLRLTKISTMTTVHIMDNKIRQVIDDKGLSYFERKEAIGHHDINYNDFTLRMSLSREDKISPPTPLPNIIETRMRKRDEFKVNPYTYVFTTITKTRGEELVEFDEFEIEVSPFGNVEENVTKVVSELVPFMTDDKVTRYLPLKTQNAIRDDYKSFEAKPRNLERTDIIDLRTKDYSVTNKLDGERFMIVFNKLGLYAVNKRLVDQIENTYFPSLTILDTELFDGRFYVFDCMVYKGQDITSKNHEYRLKRASEISTYLSYAIMKIFAPVKETRNLLTFLHSKTDIYENNDGIVYTPNDIYRSNNIYKWKFPEKMSIDFKVRLIQRLLPMPSLLDDDFKVSPYTYELQLYDKGKVLYGFRGSKMFPLVEEEARFISDRPLIDGGIYEFKYENEKFVMMRRRADKILPNFRTTGESVWNDIKNPFTEKELLQLLYDKKLKELPVVDKEVSVVDNEVSKEVSRKDAFKKYREYHNLIKDALIQRYCAHKMILDLGSGRGGDLGKYGKAKIEYLWAVEPFEDNYEEFKSRLKTSYKSLQDKTVLIETDAQSTKKITDVMGNEKADVITSFFSLSFFFFEDTNDLKKLVRTIASTLKVGGIFIGTTIDGERTEALLHKKSPFEFEGGHLKWIHHQNVEVYMDGIVGTQTESLVNFQLLIDELQKYDIVLEHTEFFEGNLELTESLRKLNSLYRTFVFRRNPSTNIDNIIRSESEDGKSLIDVVFKRLTMSDYSDCFDAFKILCKIPKSIGNKIFDLVFDFPSSEKYSARFVNDMKDFEKGYIHINPFIKHNKSLNFAKTYGCIQTPKAYLLVTSSCKALEESEYMNNDLIMISIVLQLYYSLLALSHENGYFTKITSSNLAFHKRDDIKQIVYDEVVVDVIDGVVLVFNGYENYTQTVDKPYDISLRTIFEGLPISSTFTALIQRVNPSTIEDSIKTLRKSILELSYTSPSLLFHPSSSDFSSSDSSSSDSDSSDSDDDSDDDSDGNETIHAFNTDYPISTRFRNTDRRMRGIQNAGNTCYLNSGIQSIVTALPIMQYFCNINRGSNVHVNKETQTSGELVPIFSDLVCDLTTVKTIKPIPKNQITYGIKSMIDKLDEVFVGNEQQDSSEFIVKILDGLHEELAVDRTDENRAGNSFIRELFGGRYTTKMKCLTCGYEKIRTNLGMSIELPLKDDTKTIDEALANYSVTEQVKDLDCEACSKKQIFDQKLVMSRAPEILVTSFKRFKHAINNKGDPKYDRKGKPVYVRRNNKLSFPENLIIKEENEEDEGTSDISYSLYAIVNQMGSIEGGHYTANIKNGDVWWTCNDDDVEDIEDVEDVQKLLTDNRDAYILFYHRKD